jgi:hypothetical protein
MVIRVNRALQPICMYFETVDISFFICSTVWGYMVKRSNLTLHHVRKYHDQNTRHITVEIFEAIYSNMRIKRRKGSTVELMKEGKQNRKKFLYFFR